MTTSYAELWRRVVAVAGLLDGTGVRAGDRVALLMKNSGAFIEIALAVSHVGAVLVPINFRLSPAEVDFILQDSGAALLFCDQELATWPAAVPRAITVPLGVLADASRLPGCCAREQMHPCSRDDLFRIMYTSGTTSHPKGVMHSYANFYAKTADHIAELGLSRQTRLLVAGPLYHVGAFDLPGVGVLWTGGMLAVQREFDAGKALDMMAAQRLDCAWLAPVMTSAVLAEQARMPRDTSRMAWVIGGGSARRKAGYAHSAMPSPMDATSMRMALRKRAAAIR